MKNVTAIPTIEDILIGIENGNFQPIPLWATIPGGVITGIAVSSKTFNEELEKRTTEDKSAVEAAKMFLNFDILYKLPPSKIELYILDPIIYSGGREIHPHLAAIRISTIGAWGIGTLKKDTQNNILTVHFLAI